MIGRLNCTASAEAVERTRGKDTPAEDFNNNLHLNLNLHRKKRPLRRSFRSTFVFWCTSHVHLDSDKSRNQNHGCRCEAQELGDNASQKDQSKDRHQAHPTPARCTAGHHLFMGRVISSLGPGEGHAAWGGMGG